MALTLVPELVQSKHESIGLTLKEQPQSKLSCNIRTSTIWSLRAAQLQPRTYKALNLRAAVALFELRDQRRDAQVWLGRQRGER